MAIAAGEEHTGGFAQINVTPLVDVMLVLLIIFMVAAPMLSRTLVLELGTVPDPPPVAQAPIRLVLAADHTVLLEGAPVPAALLDVALAQLATRDPRPALAIAAEPAVEYARVAQALALARNAGLTQIGFEIQAR